jgi:hypothetical protein
MNVGVCDARQCSSVPSVVHVPPISSCSAAPERFDAMQLISSIEPTPVIVVFGHHGLPARGRLNAPARPEPTFVLGWIGFMNTMYCFSWRSQARHHVLFQLAATRAASERTVLYCRQRCDMQSQWTSLSTFRLKCENSVDIAPENDQLFCTLSQAAWVLSCGAWLSHCRTNLVLKVKA